MEQSENINELLAALVEVQSEIPTMPKDSQAYGYKYADLDTITTAIKPILYKHGVAYLQSVGVGESGLTLTTRVFNKAGQWIQDTALLPVIANQKNNAAQTLGMSITYMKRYALCAMFGITSDEDTDANVNAPQKPLSPEAMGMKKASAIKLAGGPSTPEEQKEMSALLDSKTADGKPLFTKDEADGIKRQRTEKTAREVIDWLKAEVAKRRGGAGKPEEIF